MKLQFNRRGLKNAKLKHNGTKLGKDCCIYTDDTQLRIPKRAPETIIFKLQYLAVLAWT
jgi:hypothetical protein